MVRVSSRPAVTYESHAPPAILSLLVIAEDLKGNQGWLDRSAPTCAHVLSISRYLDARFRVAEPSQSPIFVSAIMICPLGIWKAHATGKSASRTW